MPRRRINLAGLNEVGRGELWHALTGELDQVFMRQFPPEQSFEHGFVNEPWRRSVSHGAFWGLEASLHFSNSLDFLEITVDGYFPWVRRLIAPLERAFARVDQLPNVVARGFVLKLLMPLLLIPLLLALPLIVAYRLATIFLWKDAREIVRHLEFVWPQVQASIQQPVSLTPARSVSLVYLIGTAVFTVAAWGVIRLAGQGDLVGAWKPLLLWLGIFLGFGSFILFIALVMILLGFEVKI